MPIQGQLSKTACGAAAVGPRDPQNGLEDSVIKDWNHWDGKIIEGPDGRPGIVKVDFAPDGKISIADDQPAFVLKAGPPTHWRTKRDIPAVQSPPTAP